MPIKRDPNSVILSNNFLMDIAAGNVVGASVINKFGANTATITGGEMVADLGGSPIFPTTASSISLASDDGTDTASGFGVATVTAIGLDENGDVAQETIDIDGAVAAPSTGSFLRVFRMFGASLGAGAAPGANNEGAITATIGGSNIAQISASVGQTLMAWYTIPQNCTGLLLQAYGSTLRSVGGILRTDFQLFTLPSSGVRRIRSKWGLQNDGATYMERNWPTGDKVNGLTDIYIHAIPSATADVAAGFTIVCFENG